MRTLIVYESYFGCTQEIAEALADESRRAGATTLTPVETARHHPVGAYDLVVVGGPTQARGLSRTDIRRAVLSRRRCITGRRASTPGSASACASGSTG